MNRRAVLLLLASGAALPGCSRSSSKADTAPATQAPTEAPLSSSAAPAPIPDPFVAPSPVASSGGASTASPPPAAPIGPDAGPSSAVTLLDAGKAPRRKVRYAWHADQKEELAMDLRTSVSMEVGATKPGDFPLPPVHIAVDVDPTRVDKDGTLAYTWRVVGASVTASASSPPAMAQGMRDEVAAIEHLTGHGSIDARGVSQATDVVVDGSTVVDSGTTGQMVEQVRQALRDVAVPWPVEDIGAGAKWQKVSRLDAKGSRLTQTDTYTLVELHGDTGSVDDVLAQSAPPQVLRAPGGPSGADAHLESLLASGTAKVTFDLGRLVPHSRFEGTTSTVMSGVQKVTMVMRLGIDVEGKPR
ncbi:MAG TPA: hypothetical protein VIF09_29275 [Polyangiaceae bacterium]